MQACSPRAKTTHLADLLRREHHALAEFLVALATFDAERRWIELGYKSLFDFLRRELKLSAGAAQNRKTAAELIRKYPAVEAALRSGELCLSSVNELAKVVTPENVAELLPRFFGKSARDAAFLAASIRPVENPPERFVVTPVRGMPSAAAAAPLERSPELHTCEVAAALTRTGAAAPVERGPELHTYEVAAAPTQTGAAAPVLPPSARPTLKPLDAERARMSLTVPRRLLDKLAAARDALSHSHPGATEEQILEVGLDLILERHAKRRGLVKKPRKVAATVPAPLAATPAVVPTAAAPARRSRHVPAAVMRAVWERDQGRCQFPVEGGGICGSTVRVQFDHIDGFALGGATSVARGRLLCSLHQDVHARALYGDEHMNEFTRPKRGGCSEPIAAYG